MSAYLVNPEHIAALASYAFKNQCCQYGAMYSSPLESAEDISDCLANANIESINHRYNDDKADPEDSIFRMVCRDRLADTHDLTSYDLAQMVGCLEYQSCEPQNWYESKAFKVLQSIRESILGDLLVGKNAIRDYTQGEAA